MDQILKIKLGREVKDYLSITFGLICYALGWAAFLLPYQITTGGVTGISAIIYYVTGIEIQVSYFIINAVFLGFALKILGPKFSLKTIYAIFMLTFLLWLFHDSLVMGTSVQWYSVEDTKTSYFPEFRYGIEFNEETCEPVTYGEWTWETGMNKNQINDSEQIRDYGMLVIYSNWSYLKNQSERRKYYKKRSLEWVAYIGGSGWDQGLT